MCSFIKEERAVNSVSTAFHCMTRIRTNYQMLIKPAAIKISASPGFFFNYYVHGVCEGCSNGTSECKMPNTEAWSCRLRQTKNLCPVQKVVRTSKTSCSTKLEKERLRCPFLVTCACTLLPFAPSASSLVSRLQSRRRVRSTFRSRKRGSAMKGRTIRIL